MPSRGGRRRPSLLVCSHVLFQFQAGQREGSEGDCRRRPAEELGFSSCVAGMAVGDALRRLCEEVGWSYAVFWKAIGAADPV